MTMITRKLLANRLPADTIADLAELRILHHLRAAGIKKRLGFSLGDLFLLIFSLVFQHLNWFQLFTSAKAENLPGKDAVYRFLNHPCFHWRRLLTGLSIKAMRRVKRLTKRERVKVLIVDDSMYERNHSKDVELLARFHDHTKNCYYKGFRMLTLGWSDGHSFLPVDFALLSSTKTILHAASNEIDKRTCGGQRCKEALPSMPSVVETLMKQSLTAGMDADYLLIDSWFTYAPLFASITKLGLPVIGMVKDTSQRY
ncbi:MAG: transposase [Negativicutes bacterium]